MNKAYFCFDIIYCGVVVRVDWLLGLGSVRFGIHGDPAGSYEQVRRYLRKLTIKYQEQLRYARRSTSGFFWTSGSQEARGESTFFGTLIISHQLAPSSPRRNRTSEASMFVAHFIHQDEPGLMIGTMLSSSRRNTGVQSGIWRLSILPGRASPIKS